MTDTHMVATANDGSACPAHAPESFWPTHWACDKPAGHRGPHIAFHRGLGGKDDRVFRLWKEGDRESAYYEHRDVAAERRALRRRQAQLLVLR